MTHCTDRGRRAGGVLSAPRGADRARLRLRRAVPARVGAAVLARRAQERGRDQEDGQVLREVSLVLSTW